MNARERALYRINFLLDVFNTVDEEIGSDKVVTTVKEDQKDESAATATTTLFEGVDDDGVVVGEKVQITGDLDVLLAKWKDSELEASDELKSYLNVIGEIVEIREDDDCIKVKLDDTKSVFVPVKACLAST